MSEPSLFRRFFGTLGRVFDAARRFTANLLFLAFLLVVLTFVLGSPGRPTVPDGAALVVSPQGNIVEQPEQLPPFGTLFGSSQVDAETAFRDLADALQHAAKDDRIRLIVLDLDQLEGVSPAHLVALGRELDAAKAAGKEVISVGNYYSQAQYFLASYADAVYMHPMGQILLSGYGAHQLYFKDALDKLEVSMHVFRVGTYKEAVEPFIRSDMSPEAEEANQLLVDELWTQFLSVVANNRKLEPEVIDRYVESYADLLDAAQGDMARLALEQRLVDELLTREEMRARIIAKVGEDEDTFRQIDHRDYVDSVRRPVLPSADPTVGVLVAAGTIQMGEQPRGSIGADTLGQLIRQARLDESIKAMVLRVDSPGGSAFASELIRQELEQFQLAGKPLVVSMAGAAASGGYWISATADEIWAEPTTITGSIGIFGILPTFEGSLGKLGIGRDGVGSTSLAGAMDPFGALTEPMSRIMQANVESGYREFLELVARGRDMLSEDVDRIGQGRVWSGQRALDLGLVDNVGSLDSAIAAAANRAALDSYETRYLEKPLTAREQLLAQLAENIGLTPVTVWSAVERQLAAASNGLSRLNDPGHLYGLCDVCGLRLR